MRIETSCQAASLNPPRLRRAEGEAGVKVAPDVQAKPGLMARIEDYALIGDCETAALVARDGAVDWLCWPRFDSDACFAALLGKPANGRWLITPAAEGAKAERRYLPDTLVLETRYSTPTGVARVIDFMPPRGASSNLVRIVVGDFGEVAFRMELVVRFGYGSTVPWVSRTDDGSLRLVAGPDMLVLRAGAPTRGDDHRTVSEFGVRAGERTPFVLAYGRSHDPEPAPLDAESALSAAVAFWADWNARTEIEGPYAAVTRRSLITLKALTYAPTGAIVAAPTTSLPEALGGARNWDYRYCWVRDAALTLLALLNAGHFAEATAWVAWLCRAVAGSPSELQVMYGVAGERRLQEWCADGLSGYEGARPVRIGNAAFSQFQLDVYGELLDALYQARRAGLSDSAHWPLERAIANHVARVWRLPDEGIWEVRSGPHHFTFSKIMAWVAMDRAICSAEALGLDAPIEHWRSVRETIRADVLARGVNRTTGALQRAYDDPGLDASLLLVADLGFVDHQHPLFLATVAGVERELVTPEGLVLRYDTRRVDDGLPPGEATFLPCSFWLANAYAMVGRGDEAVALFQKLLGLCNDVGLLAEEYDTTAGRMAGNFPQAFSHVGLVNTALNLTRASKPSRQRAGKAALPHEPAIAGTRSPESEHPKT